MSKFEIDKITYLKSQSRTRYDVSKNKPSSYPEVSLNTELQSEAPDYGRTFLQSLTKCKKVQPILDVLRRGESFFNLKGNIKLLKRLKHEWRSPKVLFEKVTLKLTVLSRESLWWSVIFVIHLENRHQSCRFCPPPRIFWTAVFETTYVNQNNILEQYFSFKDLVVSSVPTER